MNLKTKLVEENLFDMSDFKSTPIKAARAQRVKTLKAKRKMFTHRCATDGEWMALSMSECVEKLKGYNLTIQEQQDGFYLMAGYCRLLDDAGLISYGKTELKAVEALDLRMT